MTPLADSIQDYLALRRSLGFKLRDAGARLTEFASFMALRQADHITTALALEWAQQPQQCQPANWAQRLGHVRGFARHHRASDPATEVPAPGFLPFRPGRAHPYLYASEEIAGLLAQALQLPPVSGLRPRTYHALLGLLSVTGLRIGEALRLRMDDVDLDAGVLTVRGTKFGQSRLVPIHASTCEVLASYRRCRADHLGDSQPLHFFVTRTGHPLDCGDVHRTFYRLLRAVGLRGPTDSHGPRLHDFRHRFAVETLMNWYRSEQDIERRLPVLSTYLGHVHVADTYWYLSAHPHLLTLAMDRVQRRWEDRP
jgi:integrase/recombinase XerD